MQSDKIKTKLDVNGYLIVIETDTSLPKCVYCREHFKNKESDICLLCERQDAFLKSENYTPFHVKE